MKVAEINAGFDPKRDQTVDPVLWEIRRERIVELMGEGFGFYDVRRWKKAPWFINKIQYGQWATKEQIGDSGQFVDLEKDTPIRQERKKVLSICIMILW